MFHSGDAFQPSQCQALPGSFESDMKLYIFGISLGTPVCFVGFLFIPMYVMVEFLLQCKIYKDILPKIIHAID